MEDRFKDDRMMEQSAVDENPAAGHGAGDQINADIRRHNRISSASRWIYPLTLILLIASAGLTVYEAPEKLLNVTRQLPLSRALAVSEGVKYVAVAVADSANPERYFVLLSDDGGRTFTRPGNFPYLSEPPGLLCFDPREQVLFATGPGQAGYLDLADGTFHTLDAQLDPGMEIRGIAFLPDNTAVLYGYHVAVVMNFKNHSAGQVEELSEWDLLSLEADPSTGQCKALVKMRPGEERTVMLEADSLVLLPEKYRSVAREYFPTSSGNNTKR